MVKSRGSFRASAVAGESSKSAVGNEGGSKQHEKTPSKRKSRATFTKKQHKPKSSFLVPHRGKKYQKGSGRDERKTDPHGTSLEKAMDERDCNTSERENNPKTKSPRIRAALRKKVTSKNVPVEEKREKSDLNETKNKPEWKSALDSYSGKTFYYNKITRTTTWTKPDQFLKPSSKEENAMPKENKEVQRESNPSDPKQEMNNYKSPAKKNPWKQAYDTTSGKLYYYRQFTREVTWTKPEDFDSTKTSSRTTNAKGGDLEQNRQSLSSKNIPVDTDPSTPAESKTEKTTHSREVDQAQIHEKNDFETKLDVAKGHSLEETNLETNIKERVDQKAEVVIPIICPVACNGSKEVQLGTNVAQNHDSTQDSTSGEDQDVQAIEVTLHQPETKDDSQAAAAKNPQGGISGQKKSLAFFNSFKKRKNKDKPKPSSAKGMAKEAVGSSSQNQNHVNVFPPSSPEVSDNAEKPVQHHEDKHEDNLAEDRVVFNSTVALPFSTETVREQKKQLVSGDTFKFEDHPVLGDDITTVASDKVVPTPSDTSLNNSNPEDDVEERVAAQGCNELLKRPAVSSMNALSGCMNNHFSSRPMLEGGREENQNCQDDKMSESLPMPSIEMTIEEFQENQVVESHTVPEESVDLDDTDPKSNQDEENPTETVSDKEDGKKRRLFFKPLRMLKKRSSSDESSKTPEPLVASRSSEERNSVNQSVGEENGPQVYKESEHMGTMAEPLPKQPNDENNLEQKPEEALKELPDLVDDELSSGSASTADSDNDEISRHEQAIVDLCYPCEPCVLHDEELPAVEILDGRHDSESIEDVVPSEKGVTWATKEATSLDQPPKDIVKNLKKEENNKFPSILRRSFSMPEPHEETLMKQIKMVKQHDPEAWEKLLAEARKKKQHSQNDSDMSKMPKNASLDSPAHNSSSETDKGKGVELKTSDKSHNNGNDTDKDSAPTQDPEVADSGSVKSDNTSSTSSKSIDQDAGSSDVAVSVIEQMYLKGVWEVCEALDPFLGSEEDENDLIVLQQ